MTGLDFLRIVGGAAAGAVLAWAGTSLTVVGRVEALERGQGRIEAKLDRVLEANGIPVPKDKP